MAGTQPAQTMPNPQFAREEVENGNLDTSRLRAKASDALRDWIRTKRGTAEELVRDMIWRFGPWVRMELLELVGDLLDSGMMNQTDRDYLRSNLDGAHIMRAMGAKPHRRGETENTIDGLFRQISEARRSEAFLEAVAFVSRLRDYSPYNNMLVFLQRPTATYWATRTHWRQEFGREVNEEAIPLIMLQPMGPIMVVYDVADTEGPPLPEKVAQPLRVSGALQETLMLRLLKAAAADGINVAVATFDGFTGGYANRMLEPDTFVVRMNRYHTAAQRFRTLCHELGHIYLGHLGANEKGRWPCRIGLKRNQRELEAETVAYIVCRKRGLVTYSAEYLSGYITKPVDVSAVSTDMIMKVASRIDRQCGGNEG